MDAVFSSLVSVAFHGVAYGMILYVISVGLSVTMGLMGFTNLAHGVFAMAGGYILTTALGRFALPFPLALVLAFVGVAAGSVVLERTLYSRLYTAGELEQVLFTIGLIFIAVAIAQTMSAKAMIRQFLSHWSHDEYGSTAKKALNVIQARNAPKATIVRSMR